MTDVAERAEAWMRDVHRGSAAEIIPDLLDELGRLRSSVERVRKLHHPEQVGIGWVSGGPERTEEFCCHCEEYFPCATTRALGGGTDE